MKQQLYWPPAEPDDIFYGEICIFLGILGAAAILPLLLIPLGIELLQRGRKKREQARQQRQHTREVTHSIVMSEVEYQGGHPLIPHTGRVVLGLSTTQLVIYSINKVYAIQPIITIPLQDVIEVGAFKGVWDLTDSDRQVYNPDEYQRGFGITFRLEGETYLASFNAFESGTPKLLHNRIPALKYHLDVSDEVDAYILRLDPERSRLGQPDPWTSVDHKYQVGQLVRGKITNVVDFGAFACLEPGVEGLIYIHELAKGDVGHPSNVVKKGDELTLRIISIDAERRRIGLSLRQAPP